MKIQNDGFTDRKVGLPAGSGRAGSADQGKKSMADQFDPRRPPKDRRRGFLWSTDTCFFPYQKLEHPIIKIHF